MGHNKELSGEEQCVMYCTFCGNEIRNNENVTYTEDVEPTHEKCLISFNKHWEDRVEAMDLLGY